MLRNVWKVFIENKENCRERESNRNDVLGFLYAALMNIGATDTVILMSNR